MAKRQQNLSNAIFFNFDDFDLFWQKFWKIRTFFKISWNFCWKWNFSSSSIQDLRIKWITKFHNFSKIMLVFEKIFFSNWKNFLIKTLRRILSTSQNFTFFHVFWTLIGGFCKNTNFFEMTQKNWVCWGFQAREGGG